MRRLLGLGLAAIAASAVLFVAGQPAQADATIPVQSACNTGIYVNADESGLLPEQTDKGILLDGAKLFHRTTNAFLNTMPQDGAFEAVDVTGAQPLFKVETHNPYSTVNKTADGKYWSSKIAASSTGGQSHPVETPADLVGEWDYTEQTTVFSFGVGYANDTGNKATVTSITFGGTTYALDCPAKPADEHVSGEDWRCAGYYTRGGTVSYAWNDQTREWVAGEPAWGDWVKQRDLTDQEAARLECDVDTPPTTPATGSPTPSKSASASPSQSPSSGAAPSLSDSPDTDVLLPAGDNGPDRLATTGVPVLLIAAGGAALVATGAGILLLRAARKRRTEFVAE